MTYRTVDVNGKTYEYVVGKSHVKIKGIGVFTKEELGHWQARTCECCGEPLPDLYPSRSLEENYARAVSPADIRAKITESLK